MTKSEKQWWEQERAKGRDRFVLRHGLLRAGIPFGLFMIAGKILLSIFSHQQIPPAWRLLVEFGFYVLGFGVLIGLSSWQDKEREYNRATEDYDIAEPERRGNRR